MCIKLNTGIDIKINESYISQNNHSIGVELRTEFKDWVIV